MELMVLLAQVVHGMGHLPRPVLPEGGAVVGPEDRTIHQLRERWLQAPDDNWDDEYPDGFADDMDASDAAYDKMKDGD